MMKVEIKNVTQLNLDDIPEICSHCLYWSSPEEFEKSKQDPSKYKRSKDKKKQWILQTLKEFGPCCKILYYDNVPVGYAEFGPSNRFPKIKIYLSQPIGKIEDGIVFLSCLFIVNENLRGKGLGEKLLINVIADLEKRGFKGIETYARRDLPSNPSGPIELFLKNGFYVKDETNLEFPILRLNLF